tara:strand:- start:156 stop:500 length:345 start_codon:yes stop_codon:yes gene_type:complete
MKYEQLSGIKKALGDGSSLIGYVDLIPMSLVRKFGEPSWSGNGKSSGEYIFRSTNNEDIIIVLYEWKWTKYYDDENPYTVKQFWKHCYPIKFNVAGFKKHHLIDFEQWIKRAVK